jgi:plasmid maintenance system antidote protein VapI
VTALEFRQRLRALGWSQATAARHLGVSEALVSLMANGKRPVTESVADALDAAVDAALVVRNA